MTSAATGVEPVELSVDDTIRQTVRALRAARQADSLVMARALGISRQSLYNRLNGAAPFLAAEIAGLAHFFGVPITDFYEGIMRVGRATGDGTTGSYFPVERHLVAVESQVTASPLSAVSSEVSPRSGDAGVTQRVKPERTSQIRRAA